MAKTDPSFKNPIHENRRGVVVPLITGLLLGVLAFVAGSSLHASNSEAKTTDVRALDGYSDLQSILTNVSNWVKNGSITPEGEKRIAENITDWKIPGRYLESLVGILEHYPNVDRASKSQLVSFSDDFQPLGLVLDYFYRKPTILADVETAGNLQDINSGSNFGGASNLKLEFALRDLDLTKLSGEKRAQYLKDFVAELFESNSWETVIEYYQNISRADWRKELVSVFMDEMVARDPLKALASIGELDYWRISFESGVFDQAILQAFSASPDEAYDVISSNNLNGSKGAHLLFRFAALITDIDLDLAISSIRLAKSRFGFRSDRIGYIPEELVKAMIANDPLLAADFISEMGDFSRLAIESIARESLDVASQLMLSYPVAAELTTLRHPAIRAVANSAELSNLSQYLDLGETLSDKDKITFYPFLAKSIAEKDLSLAKVVAMSSDGEAGARSVWLVAPYIVRGEGGKAAIDWVMSEQDLPGGRERVVPDVVAIWGYYDENGAADWLQQFGSTLAPDVERSALTRLISETAAKNTPLAIELFSQTAGNEELRAEILQYVRRHPKPNQDASAFWQAIQNQ